MVSKEVLAGVFIVVARTYQMRATTLMNTTTGTRPMTNLRLIALQRGAALGLAAMLAQGGATATQSAATALAPASFEATTMTTRLVPTQLGRLAVHTAGDSGPVVLFWPAVFSDSTIYRAQVEALRGRYRLILIDGPGFGASEAPREPFTMEACADAAAEVLQQLDVQRVAWVGTSWGGIVGVHFAVRHPQMVRGLALMNTPFDMPAEGPGFSDRMVVWGARWIGNTDLYANGVARSFFPASWRDSHPDELAAFVATLKTPNKQGMAIAGRSVLLDRASVLPLLPQIKAPTVVVAGELDALYPAPTLKAAADRIPGARFVEIPGGGHISAMNQLDRVTALLERELTQWSQGAP
ncbi:MAG: alpha/beta fold hydrolase [Burkholderiales bacterium]|nr:alpha/beta fold hydrolase [Burkholderiales bacterium]